MVIRVRNPFIGKLCMSKKKGIAERMDLHQSEIKVHNSIARIFTIPWIKQTQDISSNYVMLLTPFVASNFRFKFNGVFMPGMITLQYWSGTGIMHKKLTFLLGSTIALFGDTSTRDDKQPEKMTKEIWNIVNFAEVFFKLISRKSLWK